MSTYPRNFTTITYFIYSAYPPNQRADIALISTSLPNPGAVTLIDVTLAAHNRQHGGPKYSVGAAAIYVHPYL